MGSRLWRREGRLVAELPHSKTCMCGVTIVGAAAGHNRPARMRMIKPYLGQMRAQARRRRTMRVAVGVTEARARTKSVRPGRAGEGCVDATEPADHWPTTTATEKAREAPKLALRP
eukprot:3880156-Prymnesium_polylepis.1